MDADGLLGLAALLLHWRATLCLVASSAFAVLLVHLLPWFNGLQGIVIAALGLFPGVVWESLASVKPESRTAAPERKTSTLVALLTALNLGAAWGGFSTTSDDTILAGLAFLALPASAWYWYAASLQFQVTSRRRAVVCICIASVAYLAAAAVLNRAA